MDAGGVLGASCMGSRGVLQYDLVVLGTMSIIPVAGGSVSSSFETVSASDSCGYCLQLGRSFLLVLVGARGCQPLSQLMGLWYLSC